MGQNAYEMSQESIDYLKSSFQMDSHCKLQVSDHKEVEVLWSFSDSQRKRLRRSEVVQMFKHLVERGLNVMRLTPLPVTIIIYKDIKLSVNPNLTIIIQVPAHVAVVSASLLLVALSLYDLHQVYVDCGIIEEMIENDKKEYVNLLTIMERILAQILFALEYQSEETFNCEYLMFYKILSFYFSICNIEICTVI